MIITRTPFRVTLGGGGTDLPSFYERHGGFVFAMGIDKYMYIMTNPPIADDFIRLHYTRAETVTHVGDLQHELAREALKFHGITRKFEVASMADLPAGTGVGSSSCYLIGLLAALHQYRRDYVPLQALAEEACHIELEVLKKPIGKQDQYMAAFGGLTVLEIERNGDVTVRPVRMRGGAIAEFVQRTHIYYTGAVRDAQEVLREQDTAIRNSPTSHRTAPEQSLLEIKDLGHRILDAVESENFDSWGQLLHEHWTQKKKLSARITLPWIDSLYDEVRAKYGVLGGKLIGAGGGGFLMLYCSASSARLEQFMSDRGFPRLHYDLETEGVKVVANIGNTHLSLHPTYALPEQRTLSSS
jgi:D-glycero-alpha-D-manno-heptose-7-phosphate kinase